MTHDELLAKINKYCEDIISGQIWTTDVFIKALRAVVELHHPLYYRKGTIETKGAICAVCFDNNGLEAIKVEYPCPTIQAIEEKLI